MKISIFILFILIFMSCKKQEFKSNPPLAPVPINKDTTIAIDNSVSFKGETWILTSYKIGDYSTPIVRNDTLMFINNKTYSFNKQISSYNLYPTLSTYTLTLNGTFLGDLSGSIYEYNIKSGIIEGLKFKDITLGGNPNNFYFLWLKKI